VLASWSPHVDWHVVWKQLFHPDGVFGHAFAATIYIAVVAQVVGIVLGLVAALMRTSRFGVLRWFSGVYVWFFRGTPVLVQIVFIYYGSNIIFGVTLIPNSVNFGLFALDAGIISGILALGINEGAYMREIIRAGIDAIDKGQMEAARSLGMTYGLAMRRIVLPQAARVIVPPLGNEFNAMLKTTSLLTIIGVHELFQDAENRYSQSFKPVEYFGAVAMWYLLLTTIWTFVQAAIERKLGESERDENALSFRERLIEAWSPRAAWARGAR
jgi:polar amino acid transport system permease protein